MARAVVLPVRGPQMSTALSSQEENSGCPARDVPIGSPGLAPLGVGTPSRVAVAVAPWRVIRRSEEPRARCGAARSTPTVWRWCFHHSTLPRSPNTTITVS
jgi:hypothetical protein